uniref:RING-type E3 ubiquitin transferase n=1 Tax=Spongospora subterranea TaxID=70186 RepID=A0A0H5R5J5_9EUKA|eukprot:CRZ09141.1 hypothetical protein [Spongospora subterranea]
MGAGSSIGSRPDNDDRDDLNNFRSYRAQNSPPRAPAPSQLTVERIRDMIARGIRPDLSLLPFQMHRMQSDGIPPPPIESDKTRVKNDLFLYKGTLKVIPVLNNDKTSSSFRISFVFDALVHCSVSIYIAAMDDSENDVLRLVNLPGIPRQPYKVSCQPGLNQYLETDETWDLTRFPPSSLLFVPYTMSYPFILRLSAEECSNAPSSVRSQTTYGTFVKQGGSFGIKVIRQRVDVGGSLFEVEEIFGLESAECVVCMSAPRNTTLFPCKHCIVCSSCAEILRLQTAKCPICRSAVFKLLKIIPDPEK